MLMKRCVTAAALALLFASPVRASPPGGKLDKAAAILEQQSRAGRGEFITYLAGAAAAYRWSSTGNTAAPAGSAYCPPPDEKLDGRGYAHIALDEYRKAKPQYASLPDYPLSVLALALLHGLQEKFPCAAAPTGPSAEPPEQK
jgi:hypothetical protein